MTQQQAKIYGYIQRFGSISPMEAFVDLGITKLATRISEMIRDGVGIEKELVNGYNRFGDKVHFMRYKLAE